METLSEKVSPMKSDQEQLIPSSPNGRIPTPISNENFQKTNDQNSDYGIVLTMPKISPGTIRVPKPFSIESIIGPDKVIARKSEKSTPNRDNDARPQAVLEEDPEIVRIRDLMKMQQYLNPLNCQQFFQHHQNVSPGNFPLNLYTNTWFNPLHSIFNLQHPGGFESMPRKVVNEEMVDEENFVEDCHMKNDEELPDAVRRTDENLKDRLGSDGFAIGNDERDDVSICGSDRDSDSGSEVSLSCCSTSEAQDLTSGKAVQGIFYFDVHNINSTIKFYNHVYKIKLIFLIIHIKVPIILVTIEIYNLCR